MGVILEASEISKSFPGVMALDRVGFNLRAGEVHALLGENGAGKSTLMKILAGVQEADSGRLTVQGREVRFRNTLDARAAGIGIIFQELNLIPHLTVAQNLFIGREHKTRWGTLDEDRMARETEEVLARLNLKIPPATVVKTLPISKQQMVEIAKALSHESRVLIMDEPTSALTEAEIDELFSVIHALRNRGVGIIYISHRLDELQHIVDRITIFRDGRSISTTAYGELTMDEIVNRMVGRDLVNLYPPRTGTPTREALLEVAHLSSPGVLEPLSFDLYRGEILGIAGLMGSGRTELARALFGADPVESKTVKIRGAAVTIHGPTDAIRHGLAYLSEDRKHEGLAVRMEVAENITMANLDGVCRLPGIVSRNEESAAAQRWIDELAIKTPSVHQKVNNLSGGNQQKVVLAKWLFRDAKILIFDEPTRGIDVGAKYAIYELMVELARKGVGVIMISSELPEILGMTDRILVMHEGRLAATLVTAATNQAEILAFASGLEGPSL
jgi:ribose transport system ATP-binding protein